MNRTEDTIEAILTSKGTSSSQNWEETFDVQHDGILHPPKQKGAKEEEEKEKEKEKEKESIVPIRWHQILHLWCMWEYGR